MGATRSDDSANQTAFRASKPGAQFRATISRACAVEIAGHPGRRCAMRAPYPPPSSVPLISPAGAND
jgi:hypothetical protein